MKRYLLLTLAIAVVLCASDANAQVAQGGPYSLNQSVIAGGGAQGTSGGVFGLDGTLGQSLAGGPFMGTGFRIDSGFWNLVLAVPSLSTTASPGITVGTGTISDSAALAGGNSPTGSITFRLYGPNDDTCVNAPAFTSVAVSVNGNGTYSSGNYAPTAAGTYHWIATYSGDANNNSVAGVCTDANEAVTMIQNSPPVYTAPLGQSANEGVSTAIGLGSFVDLTFGPWSVSVDWGDTSSNSTFMAAGAGSLGTLNHVFPDNGVYTVTVTVTDSGNLSDTKTFTVTVSTLPPTATFSNGGAVVYGTGGSVSFTGQTDPSPVDTTVGFRYAYDFNNDGTFDSGNGTYAGSLTSATAAVAASYLASVGPHTIKGRIIDKDGGVSDYTTTITVNKATLNLNAVANTKMYGAADPTFASTLSGFQFSDNAGNSGITGAASCTRNAGETVAGTYTITCTAGTLLAPNYAFVTGATANFTITKATLSVNAAANTKVYGSADPVLAATLSGFQFSDNAGNSGITGAANCTRAAGETVAGSPYTITCTAGMLLAPNYSFVTGTTANFTINKATLSVKAVANTKVYGSSDPAFTWMFTGFQFSDSAGNSGITGSASCTRAVGESVAGGPYLITCTAGNLAAPNYTFATGATANFTITKATLNANAVANTKVYGSADPAFTWSYSGFQFSDNAGNSGITGAASCTRTAGETVAGGPYLITCTAGNLSAPNYAFATGTTAGFTITKANATVVVTPYNVTYDGQPHTAAATVTGVNGETGAAVGMVNLGNTTHTNAGTYPNDTWTFTGGPNYNSIAATTITDKITTANTATSVTSSVNPVSTGQPVTFTAQVSAPGGGTPTGTVDFRDNNVTIPGCGAKDLSSLGAASCTTSSLTTGSHAITAVYSGDGNFNTSTGTLANAQVVDSPPTAVGTAADITSQGGATQTVTVVFTDNNAVNVSTIDSNDIRVTGPNGFDSAVTLVSINQNTNGTPRTAIYSFTAPGGTWDVTDNGTYTIVMQANQVSDLFPQPVAAGAIGTFTVAICNPQVTTLANAGAGSLREAVTNACNGSVITFAQNLNGTINLTAGEIDIPTNVTIQGPGANVITVSGNNTSRVFSIPPGLSVAINDLTVTGGRGDFGGGIFHLNAALSLRRVVVAGNTATSGSGGGVYNNAGTLTITDSTIASNTGGGVTNSGTLTITNSTVSGNTAGAGVANLAGAAALTSDTVTNNTSGTTNAGGGSFTVRNTIVAGNIANADAAGSYISNGYNLIGNAANSTGFNQTGDQAGSAASPINAQLSPLSSNGGPTPTHAFSSTLSPAIDKGRSFNLATDQRGSARPADFPTVSPAIGGDNSDIGAFEASVAAGGSGVDGDINRTSPASANSSDNIVDLKDLQWYDNFVNGTFIPDSGGAAQPLTVGPSTQENQRRDVAPANIAGDGCLNAQDRQQMVLYALSLAAPGAAGGPSVLNQCPQVRPGGTVDSGQWAVDSSRSSDSPMFSAEDRKRGAKIDPSVTRAVRVINSEVEGGEMLVTIEMDAAGDETRGLFTLSFDPSVCTIDSTSFPSANPSISPGDEAPRGTTIAVNASTASTGRITLLVDFNGAIPSGTEKRLVTLRFRTASGQQPSAAPVTLTPDAVQIINGSAASLKIRLER